MILLLFFLSGFTALAYEVVWQRLLHVVFGLSVYAVAIVTASFMLGLAIGYVVGQSRALSRYHPFALYGTIEGLIGLFALAFPTLLDALDVVYRASGGNPIIQLVLVFLILSVPATMMGITLPTLARYFTTAGLVGRKIGLLYAINTAGAVLGAFFTGVFFIRHYGVHHTTMLITAVNFLICLVSLIQPRRTIKNGPTGEPDSRSLVTKPTSFFGGLRSPSFLFFPFMTGFAALALQVIWVRILVCVVSNNTYSFSIVLSSILGGLAIGSSIYAVCGPSGKSRSAKALTFALVQAVAATAILISLDFFNELHSITLDLSRQIAGNHWLALGLLRLAAAGMLTIIPTIASGFVTPLLVDLYRDRANGSPETAAGIVFSANTLGAVTGALVGGFALIPTVGLSGGMITVALLTAFTGIVLLILTAGIGRICLFSGATATAVVLAATFLLPKELYLMKWYDRFQNVEGELLFYSEGSAGTVAVFQVGDIKELVINCIEEVPTHRDAISTFKILGHLPLILQPAPKTVLVNAVGGGITLGAVAKHDVVVDAVDIVPGVRDAMSFFAEENDHVLEKTNWSLIADDGRNFVKVAPSAYDAITADATHPAAAESWMLYTIEYYAQVKQKLTENGIFVQWLPLHNMAPADYMSVLRTFREIFDREALLMFTSRYTLLVGAKNPLDLSYAQLDRRFRGLKPAVRQDLEKVGITTPADMLKYIIFDGPGIDALVGNDYPILSDDHTSVEFAELNRMGLSGTMPFILARLLPHIHPEQLATKYDINPRLARARTRFMRSKAMGTNDPLERSYMAIREVHEASLLAPTDADIDYYKQISTLEFLDLLHAEYDELLRSAKPKRLLSKARLAVELRPEVPFAQELLGVTLLKLGEYDKSVPPLEAAARLKPNDFNYLSNLAFAYEQTRLYQKALETLELAAKANPDALSALGMATDRVTKKLDEEGITLAR